MNEEAFLFISFMLIGILEILQGLPLLLEKIKPNKLYGFRLKATLNDEKTWYRVNKITGKYLIYSGIIVIIGMMFSMIILDNLTLETIVLIGMFLLIFPLAITIYVGFVSIKK